MTSGETLPRGEAASGTTTGIVLVAHGGQASSTEPTSALQPAVLRMIPVGAAIWYALRGSGAVVQRPRFRVRGWNGAQSSPVDDLNRALECDRRRVRARTRGARRALHGGAGRDLRRRSSRGVGGRL